MYKAMLVDDESIVREGIKKLIDWEGHGFETVETFPNGAEALKAIQGGYAPDLIITDICMPFLNGLDLTESVARQKSEPMVIILSGYDDFKFAQKAVKLGVYDYILKPVTASDMTQVLSKAKKELDSRSNQHKEVRNLQDCMEDALPLLQTQFLNSLVRRKQEPEKVEQKLREYGISLKGNLFTVGIIDIDDLPGAIKLFHNAPGNILQYAVFNIVDEIALQDGNPLVFLMDDGRTVLVFSEGENRPSADLSSFLSRVAALIRKSLGFTVSAGIGAGTSRICDLSDSFGDAESALKLRFFKGYGSIIRSGDTVRPSATQINFDGYEKKLAESLKNGSMPEAKTAVTDFLAALRVKGLTMERCLFYIHRMSLSIANLIGEIDGEKSRDLMNEALEKVNAKPAETLEEAGGHLVDLCGKFLKRIAVLQRSGVESIALRAKQYIRENYFDPDISLNSVAAVFSVSVSYFCSLFKSQTGKTFLEYLNQFRMEKAKNLLKGTNRSICDIAESVGYMDQHYFSIAFKKYSGLTPKGYRSGKAKRLTE